MKTYVIQNSDGRYISNLRYIDFTFEVEKAVTFKDKDVANKAIKKMKKSEEWSFFSRGDKPKLTVKVAR